jgi:hypothetical protein
MSAPQCPGCGKRHFQIVIRQLAEVKFDETGDHEVTDGPFGDLEWDDDSFVICSTNHGGCGWAGTLREATPVRKVWVCTACGSPRVSQDACVDVNSEEVSTYDDMTCQDCENEGNSVIREVEVPFDFDLATDTYKDPT